MTVSASCRATQQARAHHDQALTIARDTGTPLDEASALEGIGHSYLHDGNPSHAVTPLHQALTIYQRTDIPSAQRVQQTLHHQL
jgi:hypothetical protein